MLLAEEPLACGPGRRRGGRLESEDLPSAPDTEPLAEGGFVQRRLVLLALALAAWVLLLPAVADTARVTIRVEGKTRTIFAPAPWRIDAPDAMAALRTASTLGEFFVDVRTTSFGPYVSQIGLYPGAASSGWVYKVNGVSPPVGADQYQLKDGDAVLWYWADFDATTGSGPPTLLLERTGKRCYASFSQDDAGRRASVTDVRVWIAGVARFTSATGRFCAGRRAGLVRVTKDGAVRSAAIA
jgi:hypothetical protein